MPVDDQLVFKDWAVVASPYHSPEIKICSIRGTIDGRKAFSGGLVRKEASLTYRTHENLIVRLEGPPEPGYAEFCQRNGIELDLADPVKFRARVEDFEWLPSAEDVERSLGGRGGT